MPRYCHGVAAICLLLAHAAVQAQALQTGAPADAPRGAYISPLLPGHHRLPLNGIASHYEVMGDGPLLVITAPRKDLDALSRHFTLVVFDTPGNGDAADHLDALRRTLKREKIDLLGDAQGAATAYAARYPAHVRRVMTDPGDVSTEQISKFFLRAE